MRWRVRFVTERPHWTYYAGTAFVDAVTESQAAALVETERTHGDTRVRAWEVVPASRNMEAAHLDRVARRAEWLRRIAEGRDTTGLL
jgi:hypothetical protein